MPEETVGAAELATCDCEPCKRKGGLAHNVRPGTIHDYSSTPRAGWRPRFTAAEERDGLRPPTFGIELETSAPSYRVTDLANRPYVPYLPVGATDDDIAEHHVLIQARETWERRNRRHRDRQTARLRDAGTITADEAVSLASPRGLWHAKHDGSVTGPEFASQPASLAYWRAQRGHLAGMFKALLHGGMRSHDGDTCGFHVNIGTSAFDDADGETNAGHLARFARLITMNSRWSIRMAQRTHTSARWARFDAFPDNAACIRWGQRIRSHGYVNCDHTDVLNASHSGRIEFRLPRGTLRLDRFYAKLEWAAAMVEYTRDESNAVRPSDFMRWAERSGEYPELVKFMRERFNAARFGEVADTAPAPTTERRTWVTPEEFVERRTPLTPEELRSILNEVTPTPPTIEIETEDASSPDVLTVPLDERPVRPTIMCNDYNEGYGYVCTRMVGHIGNHAATDVTSRQEWSA